MHFRVRASLALAAHFRRALSGGRGRPQGPQHATGGSLAMPQTRAAARCGPCEAAAAQLKRGRAAGPTPCPPHARAAAASLLPASRSRIRPAKHRKGSRIRAACGRSAAPAPALDSRPRRSSATSRAAASLRVSLPGFHPRPHTGTAVGGPPAVTRQLTPPGCEQSQGPGAAGALWEAERALSTVRSTAGAGARGWACTSP
jgi:hypothetical protein